MKRIIFETGCGVIQVRTLYIQSSNFYVQIKFLTLLVGKKWYL